MQYVLGVVLHFLFQLSDGILILYELFRVSYVPNDLFNAEVVFNLIFAEISKSFEFVLGFFLHATAVMDEWDKS